MDKDAVTQAIAFIDSVLAKVACSRDDHRRLAQAIDLISDAVFGETDDEE